MSINYLIMFDLGVCVFVAMRIGWLPRVGVAGALALRIRHSGITKSKAIAGRDNEIRALRAALSSVETAHPTGFIVIHGPERIGKHLHISIRSTYSEWWMEAAESKMA
jgi:hypothetical protein